MIAFLFCGVLDDPALSDDFESFVNGYKRLMMSAAMNVLHDYHDAEDAVMDALVSIAKHFSKIAMLDEKVKRVYVCRSARNRALNILSERTKRTAFELPIEEADNAGAVGYDTVTFGEDDAFRISECLKLLPMKYRDVMYLYYAEEMTAAKISELLGINKKTVQTRLRRGKKELQRLLVEEG